MALIFGQIFDRDGKVCGLLDTLTSNVASDSVIALLEVFQEYIPSVNCVLSKISVLQLIYTRGKMGVNFDFQVQLANHNQLGDHYASKHPKEKPLSESG